MQQLPFAAFVSDSTTALAYWFLDCLWIIHATVGDTNGEYSVIEQFMPEGSTPPPHVHSTEEIFFVIEGEMTVRLGEGENEKIVVFGPGCLGNVPRNTIHHFKTTKGPCRVLYFCRFRKSLNRKSRAC